MFGHQKVVAIESVESYLVINDRIIKRLIKINCSATKLNAINCWCKSVTFNKSSLSPGKAAFYRPYQNMMERERDLIETIEVGSAKKHTQCVFY